MGRAAGAGAWGRTSTDGYVLVLSIQEQPLGMQAPNARSQRGPLAVACPKSAKERSDASGTGGHGGHGEAHGAHLELPGSNLVALHAIAPFVCRFSHTACKLTLRHSSPGKSGRRGGGKGGMRQE